MSLLAFNDLTQGEINECFKGYLWFDLMVKTFGFFDGALASTGLSVLKWNMPPQHFWEYFLANIQTCISAKYFLQHSLSRNICICYFKNPLSVKREPHFPVRD